MYPLYMYIAHDNAFQPQSNVPLDIQEIDKSSAVVSYTPPNPEVHVNFLFSKFTYNTVHIHIDVDVHVD